MYFDSKKRILVAKAIINGRKYSTETAKLICWENSPIHPNDWGAIYKKKTGINNLPFQIIHLNLLY